MIQRKAVGLGCSIDSFTGLSGLWYHVVMDRNTSDCSFSW
jgi:hypothetical protein